MDSLNKHYINKLNEVLNFINDCWTNRVGVRYPYENNVIAVTFVNGVLVYIKDKLYICHRINGEYVYNPEIAVSVEQIHSFNEAMKTLVSYIDEYKQYFE